MMILLDKVLEESRVNSDFLIGLARTTGMEILTFSRCKLPNRKFCKLVDNNQYFILPYVLYDNREDVAELVREIKWCSANFKGRFGVKYTRRS